MTIKSQVNEFVKQHDGCQFKVESVENKIGNSTLVILSANYLNQLAHDSCVLSEAPRSGNDESDSFSIAITMNTVQVAVNEAWPVVSVMFRMWRDVDSDREDLIALFPEIPADVYGQFCSSYMHMGQHGGADCEGIVKRSRPAKPEEYEALKRELESYPYAYRLKACERRTPEMARKFDAEMARFRKEANPMRTVIISIDEGEQVAKFNDFVADSKLVKFRLKLTYLGLLDDSDPQYSVTGTNDAIEKLFSSIGMHGVKPEILADSKATQ